MNGFLNTLKSLGPAKLLAIGTVMVGLLGFFAFITERIATPSMALLYGGLDSQDSSDIVTKLDGLSIKYRLVGDGGSILVPQDQVPRLRIMMAEQGLPTGGSMGYEIFDRTNAFGTTSFVQNINQLRALEGELSRTIRSITNVAAARVHLVLPKNKLFNRDSQEATASIVLKARGGTLSHSQVMAIQHLTAAAVPGLAPSRVSIVDERGSLLASGSGKDGDGGMAGALQDQRTNHEKRIKNQLEGLLEKYVGPGKARVEVSVEIDFDRVTTNEEFFDPDQQVVLSTLAVEETKETSDGNGSGGTVSVADNLPDATQAAAEKTSTDSRTEERTNFENSKTMRTEVHEAGQIKKISVAVLVDGKYRSNDDGTTTYIPRSDEEKSELEKLVRSAVGFNAERGDVVEVINLQFAPPEIPEPIEVDAGFMGLGLSQADIFRAAELIVFLIVGLLAIFFVARPLVNRLFTFEVAGAGAGAGAGGGGVGQITDASQQPRALPSPGQGGQAPTDAAAGEPDRLAAPLPKSEVESMIDVAQIDGRIQQSAIKKVGDIVERHPEEATSILRSWLHE